MEIKNAFTITVNRTAAKSGAWTVVIIGSGLVIGGAYIVMSGSIEEAPLRAALPLVFILGWMFSSLAYSIFWLLRLSQFNGPLITLTPDGIYDHWNEQWKNKHAPPKYWAWNEIAYTEWKDFGAPLKLVIIPKKRKLFNFRRLLGHEQMQYPAQYFLESAHDIAKYMIDHAPSEVLR